MKTFPSRTLLWLKDGWEQEYTSDLGPPYVLHVHATKKAQGALVHRVVRIIDQRHILWLVERDLNTPGDYKGRGLRPKKDAKGRVIKRMGEWLQPFHEAVKRLAPRHDGHPSLRFYWLVSFLHWRRDAATVNPGSVVAHLAAEAHVTQRVVEMSIERAAREAARTIGDRVRGNPVALSVQSVQDATQRPSRQRSHRGDSDGWPERNRRDTTARPTHNHGGAEVAG